MTNTGWKRDDSNGRNHGYYWVNGEYLIHRHSVGSFELIFNGESIASCETQSGAKDFARSHAATQSFKGLVRV